jgi:hypothetical protein
MRTTVPGVLRNLRACSSMPRHPIDGIGHSLDGHCLAVPIGRRTYNFLEPSSPRRCRFFCRSGCGEAHHRISAKWRPKREGAPSRPPAPVLQESVVAGGRNKRLLDCQPCDLQPDRGLQARLTDCKHSTYRVSIREFLRSRGRGSTFKDASLFKSRRHFSSEGRSRHLFRLIQRGKYGFRLCVSPGGKDIASATIARQSRCSAP